MPKRCVKQLASACCWPSKLLKNLEVFVKSMSAVLKGTVCLKCSHHNIFLEHEHSVHMDVCLVINEVFIGILFGDKKLVYNDII